MILQVEQLEPQHQIEEFSAVENSSQVQFQQASETTMIADAVYNESQIGLKYQGRGRSQFSSWTRQSKSTAVHPSSVSRLARV